MTQKRFRKLLMSKGYERNGINEIVKNTIKSGKSYADVYKVMTVNLPDCMEAFAEACKGIQRIAAACAKAISAAADAFYAAMKEGSENEIPK